MSIEVYESVNVTARPFNNYKQRWDIFIFSGTRLNIFRDQIYFIRKNWGLDFEVSHFNEKSCFERIL